MKALIFDPFSGASGDMMLGALIDLGADAAFIQKCIEAVTDVSFSTGLVSKNGIYAAKANIEDVHENNARTYFEIVGLIQNSDLIPEIKANALSVFEIIAKAESRIHHKTLDHLHFHETGQNDAIADVVGSCAGFYDLAQNPKTAYETILCKPINVGGGFVRCAHGELPVPAPATLEILRAGGLPFFARGDIELLTPTGAALLSHFAKPAAAVYGTEILTGYGAGCADTNLPNVLRASLVETDDENGIDEQTGLSSLPVLSKEHIEILETNVDDVTGEIIGHLMDELMEMGARDVSVSPIFMKKGRPAHLIRVIAKPADSEKLARKIITETGSLGVRVIPSKHRLSVFREIKSIEMDFSGKSYTIPVKIARLPEGGIVHISAEYENCKQIAKETGLPLQKVIQKTESDAQEKFAGE
ncbi:Pyridinium-3,5-bisthiocarboxylic acid mononucleotide nickel insertion protein [Methanosarcinaceae archaeon Ag5]|uniref:Putative nickel insertion protein n=1 Tax=Methanolapillus africanus TaxID=3028297 RepID=A0AAE4MI28_9EURY|nr:Pyridinium-3,5-bisthiocarboxylic acid mononucleotide nickel insertion protein [Methanosarcinaceae archaeon Ag5]